MNRRRMTRSARPWYLYVLGAIVVAIVVLGVTELGTPSSSARTSKEVVAAEDGVVQNTVSGSGNVEPGVDQDVNFATSGTLNSINVKVGQHVTKGQLIATLNPSSAELTLAEAKLSLTEAEDQLTSAEDGDSSGSSSDSSDSSNSDETADSTTNAAAEFVSDDASDTGTTTTGTTTTPTTTTGTTTTPTGTTTYPGTTTTGKSGTSTTKTGSGSGSTYGSGSSSTGGDQGSEGDSDSKSGSSGSSSADSASSIAADELQVDSAQQTVDADEKAVDETKLYAPVSGTIASLADDTVGQTISSGSDSSSAASSSSDASGAEGEGASSSDADSGSTSSSAFAEIINSKTMTMTVSLSESDISSVKVGQMATVSISALSGVELGAKVTSISPLGTTSDDVTSYDATLTIYQRNSKVKPGMSATATIVTSQAQGVTVPNEAITGSGSTGYVNVEKNGKTVSKEVVVGLRGSSRSQIVSGLSAGQDVVVTITLPALGTSTTSSSSTSSTSGFSGFGGGGFGGGGFGGGGFARAFSGGGAP